MSDQYPPGTVRALLQTNYVSDITRQTLTHRLGALPCTNPQFFTGEQFALLQAICDRLIPQTDHPDRIDIAGGIDERLTQHKGNGWRYDLMPPDGEAYRLGLQGIEESALALFGKPFQHLSEDRQDDVLRALERLEAVGQIWQHLSAERFFEELLAEAAELYYSHPLAQEEIGYVGMADLPTWQRIGLNQREDREPKPV